MSGIPFRGAPMRGALRDGLPRGTQTPDPQLRRLVLYPVELWAVTPAILRACSAPGVLGLPEQHLARPRVVVERTALAGEHVHAADHRGAGGDLVEPPLEVRELRPGDALVLPGAQPREHGHVGDAVVPAADVARPG